MAINPLGSGGIPEAGSRRIQNGAGEADAAQKAPSRASAADSVHVSTEARKLAVPDIPADTLPVDYLKVISERVADGTYQSDAVIRAIADGITPEL